MFDDEINAALGYEEQNRDNILKNIDTSMFSNEQLIEQEQIVEAILFMMGDSVTIDTLAISLSCEHDIALAAAERLVQKYNTVYKDRGMKVIRINHKYQMVANNKYFKNLVLVASKPQKPVLTDAVLETLSIIAYKQPITKPEIEDIRGVKSDFAVNRLIEYGLVEERGRLDAPGRPIILGTTEEFLLRFGLESTDDLPILPPTRAEEIKNEVEKELTESLGETVRVDDVEDIDNKKIEGVTIDKENNNKNDNENEDKNIDVKNEINAEVENETNNEINTEENIDNKNINIIETDVVSEETNENRENYNNANVEGIEIKEEDDVEILPETVDVEFDSNDFNEVDKNLVDRYNINDANNDIDVNVNNNIDVDKNVDYNYDVNNTDGPVSHERQDIQHDEKTGESDDKEPQ